MIVFKHLALYAASGLYQFFSHWWVTLFIDIIEDHGVSTNEASFNNLVANAIGNYQ